MAKHYYAGAWFQSDTLRALIGFDADSHRWVISLVAKDMKDNPMMVTVGVMHDRAGAERWAEDCLKAVLDNQPEPPDAYNNLN